MAHYAFLDENNIVTEVIVGVDENELIEGKTPEEWYGEFRNQKCVRTSYNTCWNKHTEGGIPFRGNFAGIGHFYDENADVFVPPQPFASWIWDAANCKWKAPVEMPNESCYWDEENGTWITVVM